MNGRAPGVLNRITLTLLGLGATAIGGWGLLVGTGRLGAERTDSRLIDPAVLDRWLTSSWFGYAVAAGAAVVALLALVWLLAQLPRRTGTGTIVLAEDDGIARIDHGVLAAAAREEIEGYEGVRAARVVLLGDATSPSVRITVTADERADLSTLRDRIHRTALDHLAQTLEIEPSIPTQILFVTPRSRRSTMARVRRAEGTPANT